MTQDEAVYDSPTGWVRSHIHEYVESGGEKGHRWRGVDTLLLTTRGRNSGRLRRTALIYGRDGDRFIVVASKGGAATHPEWYLNLSKEPAVRVQAGSDVFDATARRANGQEKALLWQLMASIWPAYDTYQTKTDRQIPVVVIERR